VWHQLEQSHAWKESLHQALAGLFEKLLMELRDEIQSNYIYDNSERENCVAGNSQKPVSLCCAIVTIC